MGQFFIEYWPAIILSIITAVLGFLLKDLWTWIKERPLRAQQQNIEQIDAEIEVKIEPVVKEIEELRAYVREHEELDRRKMSLILSSYKYRLSELCKIHISNGYITRDDYAQLDEFYKVYHGLGGNGQAEELYHRAINLELR